MDLNTKKSLFEKGVIDDKGVEYSEDGKRLLLATNLKSSEYCVKPGTEVICDRAFYNCNVERIEMPDGLLAIGEEAFYRCTNLNEVIIPEGVTTIRRATFRNCDALDQITLPSTINKMEGHVFDRNMQAVVLQSPSIEFDMFTFSDAHSLEQIYVPKTFEADYIRSLQKCRVSDKVEGVEMEESQQQLAGRKHRYKVSFACYPYCVQMFKADEDLKQRCLEAARNEELSSFWGDYAYEGYDFDYEREVLTWDSRMDFSVYDEDDNEIFHTDDMKDFDLWGQQDEDGDYTDFEGMPDGDYFIGFDTMKGSCWEGTFEAEEFDPKKLTFDRSKDIDDEFPLIGDDVMEVACLRYNGEQVDLEFQSDNGSYGWTSYLYHCKEKDWWEEIEPEDDEDNMESDEEETEVDSDTSLSVNSDYDPEELRRLHNNVYDARRAYLEKATERLKQLSEIAAEKGHDEDFGWLEAEAPDSDEDEDEYERFDEMKFHVIRYDDFAYQTSEIIGIRFRLDNGEIIITAYYDDDNGEIVEDCELYFNYDYAENYNAVATCIEIVERELD